jgi:uncharacterized membrane protein required for colicin V production
MAIIDVILLITITGFTLFGFWFGFIHTLGSVVGFFGGIFVASRFFDYWGGSIMWRVFMFVLLYVVVGRLIGLLFALADRVFNIVSIVPFTSLFNRVLGATFGFLEGIMVITGVVFILNFYELESWLGFIAESKIVPLAMSWSKVLIPFVTKALATI